MSDLSDPVKVELTQAQWLRFIDKHPEAAQSIFSIAAQRQQQHVNATAKGWEKIKHLWNSLDSPYRKSISDARNVEELAETAHQKVRDMKHRNGSPVVNSPPKVEHKVEAQKQERRHAQVENNPHLPNTWKHLLATSEAKPQNDRSRGIADSKGLSARELMRQSFVSDPSPTKIHKRSNGMHRNG